jgi:hypothetical protein
MNSLYFRFDAPSRSFKVSLLDPDPAHEAGNRPTAPFNFVYVLGFERVVLPVNQDDFLRVSLALVQNALEEPTSQVPTTPTLVETTPKQHRHRHCEVCLTPICKIVEERERREARRG